MTESHRRMVIAGRHAERVDLVFGDNWINTCFEHGQYKPTDLNQPHVLPQRPIPGQWLKDSPITNIGMVQASLVGKGFLRNGIKFSTAVSSCAFRSLQTAAAILEDMGQGSLPIKVEPGLFEWMHWYPVGERPTWFTPEEKSNLGFNIDLDYKPVIKREELITKYASEDINKYYERSHSVVKDILSKTSGNVLFIGHAATPEVCTRQLVGKQPRDHDDFRTVLHYVPFCGIGAAQEVEANSDSPRWTIVKPPVLPLHHRHNNGFNWHVIASDKPSIDFPIDSHPHQLQK
ncbi:Protein UBASH3A -like protein [Halotydeus destructor]|nr:Protein UBASH3A -like protein [Halotydeus destructor]